MGGVSVGAAPQQRLQGGLVALAAGDSSQDEAEEDVKQVTVSWPRGQACSSAWRRKGGGV